jgi:hypothetical protein
VCEELGGGRPSETKHVSHRRLGSEPRRRPVPARAQGPDPGEDAAPAKGGGAKAGLARAPTRKGKGEKKTRVVHMNDGQQTGDFVGNGIRTAKYNVLTFGPIFLWEMFSRAAYFYFLIQARPCCARGAAMRAVARQPRRPGGARPAVLRQPRRPVGQLAACK